MRLILEHVSHAYGETAALDEVSLEIAEGEIIALIGPSGCGKSTLLGIAGGLLQPSAGRVLMQGAVPAHCLNPLTYVFQDFALLPWRTVERNIALVLEHHPLSTAERAALTADVLRRTKLADFAHAYPRQLSGGMRQRVGIARALVVKPAMLLLDEPLSALDAQTRELLMEDFLDLWLGQRIGAVYVTHNLHEALRLADRIVVLSRRPGRVREVVEVAIPQRERAHSGSAAELARVHDRLWALIKAEAQDADKELLDAH